ncbi:MAG TPA: OsmC family protein [Planctomycetota bacterium]|nr:OsmC family protein [Planctomycetota bacterium]
MQRTAVARWNGGLKSGRGALTTSSGALKETPYSFGARFESGAGTNPEELIAAAHAGCFTMALSAALEKAGVPARTLVTEATVVLEQTQGGWSIASSRLRLEADVPGAADETFEKLAAEAKENCPVSRALRVAVTLETKRVGG